MTEIEIKIPEYKIIGTKDENHIRESWQLMWDDRLEI